MKPPLGSQTPERRHLNMRFTVRDVDMIVNWWQHGNSIRSIALTLHVSSEEIAAILRDALKDERITS